MKRNWPEGKHVAVLFTIMFEGWEEGAAPGVGPMGNALKPGYYDTANAGWAKYAANNGLERQLKILKEEEIKASVFCSGVQMERHPDLIKKIAAEGHEVCLHSLAQNIIPIYLDEATEREQMSHCLDLAVSLTGKHPVGYCSPRCTPSLSTSKLLAENGLKYTIDWMGSDLPMVEHTEAGDICLMPFPMNVNDMPLYVRYGNAPDQYYRNLVDEFDNWYAKHPEEKVVYWVTAHSHVFGRPFGAVQFQRCIQYIKSLPYVWIAQPHEVASTVLDVTY